MWEVFYKFHDFRQCRRITFNTMYNGLKKGLSYDSIVRVDVTISPSHREQKKRKIWQRIKSKISILYTLSIKL